MGWHVYCRTGGKWSFNGKLACCDDLLRVMKKYAGRYDQVKR